MSVTGKLEVLQRQYQQVGKLSLDSNYDAEWKEAKWTIRRRQTAAIAIMVGHRSTLQSSVTVGHPLHWVNAQYIAL